MSATGVKERGFVYANGGVLAIQTVAGGVQSVKWQHYDASDASFRATDASGQSSGSAELDPVGADAGLFKPLQWNPPTSSGKLVPYYGIPELLSASDGCVLDRIQVPCDLLQNLIEAGAVEAEYFVGTQPKSKQPPTLKPGVGSGYGISPAPGVGGLEIAHAGIVSFGLGLFGVDLQVGWRADNEAGYLPVWDRLMFSFARANPQNPTSTDQLHDRAQQLHGQPNRNDCLALVDLIRTAANLFPNVISATAALGVVLTGAGFYELALRTGAGHNVQPQVSFGNNGFRSGLAGVPGDNQVRHFIGGLLVGQALGTSGLARMNAREVGNGVNEVADRNLNGISVPLGAELQKFNGEYGPTPGLHQAQKLNELADAVKDKVCQP